MNYISTDSNIDAAMTANISDTILFYYFEHFYRR